MGKWEKEVLATGFDFAPIRILPASYPATLTTQARKTLTAPAIN